MQLPCLTVRQPFASALLAGLKPAEYRTWPTRIRGWLAVHAAASRPRLDDCDTYSELQPDELPRSVILGVVEVTDCLPYTEGGWEGFAWHVGKRLWLPAEHRKPVKGRLGIWTAEIDWNLLAK